MKLDNTEKKQLKLAQIFAKGSFALKLKEKIKRLRDDSGGAKIKGGLRLDNLSRS